MSCCFHSCHSSLCCCCYSCVPRLASVVTASVVVGAAAVGTAAVGTAVVVVVVAFGSGGEGVSGTCICYTSIFNNTYWNAKFMRIGVSLVMSCVCLLLSVFFFSDNLFRANKGI